MAQVIEVRPYAVKDPALPHVIQRQPHRVGVVGLHLAMLGEVTDHGVPCHPACDDVGNFVTMPSIKACVQQLRFLFGPIKECLVSWQLLLRRQRFAGVFLGAVLFGAVLALLSPCWMDFQSGV